MKNFCLWAKLLTLIVIAFAFNGLVFADVQISGDALVRTRLQLNNDKSEVEKTKDGKPTGEFEKKDESQINSYNIYRFGVDVKASVSDNATLGCRLASESPTNFIDMGKGTKNLPEVTFQYAYLQWKIKNKVTFTGGRFPYSGGFLADLHFNPNLAAGLGAVDDYFLVFHANALEGFMCSTPLVKGNTGVDIEIAASPDTERFGSKEVKGETIAEHDSYDVILAVPITALAGKLKLRPAAAVRTTADDKALDSIGNIRITGGASGSFAVHQKVSVGFGAGYSMISTDNLDNNTIGFSAGPSIKGLGPGTLDLRFDMFIFSKTDKLPKAVKLTNPYAKVNYFIPLKDKVVLDFLYRMYMRTTDDEKVDWMRNQFDVTLKAKF
ncbi:hypothetical protein FJZ31_17645 [Candidatus Poribacteria bacterium]|nr:hypothetical protein [Candidatus Poribacteria bacterium]